jgi:hypothetical protein
MNSFWSLVFEKLNGIISLLNGGSYDLNSEDGVIRNSYWKTLVEKINLIIASLINSGGGPGVFVREYNGEVGIGVDVIPSGNPPSAPGNDGDYYFTLAFNSGGGGLPEGWMIVAWDRIAGMWELSSTLLPISAKDLHWVAVKNGADVNGYYVILAGDTAADLPKWELLGAAAVVPDGETIDYNAEGKLEAKRIKPVNVLTDFRAGLTAGKLPVSYVVAAYRYGNMMTISLGGAEIGTTIAHGDTLLTVTDTKYRSLMPTYSPNPISPGEISISGSVIKFWDGALNDPVAWLNVSLTYICNGE